MIRARGGALYTGITTDVTRRFAEHTRGTGRGARSLRGKGPLALVLTRAIGPRGLALRLEHQLKRLPKTRKEQLVVRPDAITRMLRQLRKRQRPGNPAPTVLESSRSRGGNHRA